MKTTSLEAYKNMQPKIPNDKETILSVLSHEKELTYNEIARKVRCALILNNNGLESQKWTNPNKVSRRMKELIESKKVIYGETRECSVVKSNCVTYLKA